MRIEDFPVFGGVYVTEGLTYDISSPEDGWVRLALAVFVIAIRDALGRDLKLRADARKWLRKDGKLWMSILNMDDTYDYIMRNKALTHLRSGKYK